MTETENRIQQSAFMWFHNTYPEYRGLFFRVKNEGHSRISGAIGKATGIIPGVSDMIMLLPFGKVMFFEFKIETGRQSNSQKAWQSIIEKVGYNYYLVHSLKEFQRICQEIGL